MKTFPVLIVALALALSAGAQAPTPGKKLDIVAIAKIQSTVTMPQGEMNIPVTSETYTTIVINDVKNNMVTGTNTITRIKTTTSIMGMDNAVDSDDPASKDIPQVAEAFKMVKQAAPFTHNMDVDVPAKMDINALQGKMTADEFFLPISSSKLKENYAWTQSMTDDKNTTMGEMHFLVKRVSNGEAEITSTGNMDINTTNAQQGMEIKQKMKGTFSSSSVYDMATGMLRSSTSTIDMSGTMEVAGNTSPLSIKTSITTTAK